MDAAHGPFVVKLGGSVITRKREVERVRPKILRRLAEEVGSVPGHPDRPPPRSRVVRTPRGPKVRPRESSGGRRLSLATRARSGDRLWRSAPTPSGGRARADPGRRLTVVGPAGEPRSEPGGAPRGSRLRPLPGSSRRRPPAGLVRGRGARREVGLVHLERRHHRGHPREGARGASRRLRERCTWHLSPVDRRSTCCGRRGHGRRGRGAPPGRQRPGRDGWDPRQGGGDARHRRGRRGRRSY